MEAPSSLPAPALLLRRMGHKVEGAAQTISGDGAAPMLRFQVEAVRGSLVVQLTGIPDGTASIQWTQNGTPIAGQTGTSIHFAELTSDATDVYYALFRTPTGEMRSQAFLVVVEPGNPLLNISARGYVTATKPLIVGIAIGRVPGQSSSKRYLIRVIGDSLRRFGVSESLARPVAALHRGRVKLCDLVWSAENTALASKWASKVGAFALDPAAAEIATVIELSPGAYSIIVVGAEAQAGEVLVEVYEIPA